MPLLFILDFIVSASWFSYVTTSNSHFHCVLYSSVNRTFLRFKIRLIGLVETNHQQRRQCLQCDCVSWAQRRDVMATKRRCVTTVSVTVTVVYVTPGHLTITFTSRTRYSLLHTVVNLHALTWTSTVLVVITTCK